MRQRTTIKTPFLQGTTPRIKFRIADEDGTGFKPSTLTYSVYDVDFKATPATQTIVNGRNDVDALAECDVDGNVLMFLAAADTDVDVPDGCVPATLQRRILFTWTWSTTRVGKHEVILTIAPDRETVAS